MGCNTSKDSIQQAVEEAKEDVKETAKDIARDLLKDETKEEVKNGDVPKSAETATIGESSPAKPSESSEASTAEAKPADGETDSTDRSKEGEEELKENGDATDREKEEEAATRIQAAFRGHHARKSMKETGSGKQGQNADAEPTKEQLEQEFREDDEGLCHAATKIQATFRGHMSRKIDQAAATAKGMMESAADKMKEEVSSAVNELEGIDLSDPNLNKAATKIQASFRGHKVRQEIVVPTTDEKK